MEDQRVAEYFVIGGLTPDPVPLSQCSCEGAALGSSHSLAPITDIAIVNISLGETVPEDYVCLSTTPSGLSANLNYGVIRSQEIFLCYRRGRDKPPLFDIGVLLEGREKLMLDSQVLQFTLGDHSANININGVAMYMTYRRSTETTACNELVVSDICVIMANKGESAPHSYCTIERNLNKGTMVGSDIFVCYKKSVNHTNYIAYKPGILDKYPLKSRPSFPLPADLSLFCLPMGATLEAWPPQAPKPDPVFSTFVLTVSRTSSPGCEPVEGVDKVYGAAITFYERYCHKKLTNDQFKELKLGDHFGGGNVVHTNKCICILSMWPFFDTFDKFLRYLLEIANSSCSKVPIERYVWHMLDCVPFPSARRPRILIQLDAKSGISLVQPEDSPIPLSGASFRKLVMNLHPEGCLQVLMFALTEQKILLHSLRPHVLTSVAEAISSIIFPFHWQCPYIPLCPLGLSDILDAPIPFLIGLDSRFFDLYDPPPDIICIDLDTAAMSVPEDKRYLSVKMLPKKPTRLLKSSLEALCASIKEVDAKLEKHRRSTENQLSHVSETDFKMIRKEQELETAIQETFLRFMASILKGYSQYLLPIVAMNSPDAVALFDADAYVKSRDRSYQKFYEIITATQMFSKFIEERTFVSDKNASLVFFDDCIEKLTDDETGSKFLEIEVTSSEHTLFLPPPEPPTNAPSTGYSYKTISKLNPELFPSKPIPTELTEAAKTSSTLGIPGSPLARRSKHEVKSAQKLASKHYQTPMLWAKCLLATSFSVWFAHLPSFVAQNQLKAKVLDLAFNVLQKMQQLSLSHQDEVCYRVMMQLCGVYSKPVLAVKTLCEMKNAGITPNAITYGYYNRALLESKWNQSNLLWSKLRNVIKGATAFRQSGSLRAQRRKSLSLEDSDKVSADPDSCSRLSSEDSTCDFPASQFKCDTLSSDPGYCSVNENLEQNIAVSSSSCDTTPTVVSSAGLLMTSLKNAETLKEDGEISHRKSDLAEALSPTLLKYDQIKEPSAPINFESTPEKNSDGLNGTVTYGLASSLASQGLRQATKHIESLRATYIDPTVTEWTSPSNFNYRRSINTMRSAVTSFSRKYNEIKEAFTTAPPRNTEECEDEVDGFWNFNKTTKETFDEEAFSGKIIHDFQTSWIPSGPYCLGIWQTSCSRCRSCKKILFDEEIMAGWSPDDNNLNTKCWHCNQGTLPLLSIDLFYLRHLSKSECCCDIKEEKTTNHADKKGISPKEEGDNFSYIQEKGEKLDRFTVPYLSPLVLRKELETMLGHDGDSCLTELTLLNNHPILYWNMIWYFSRLGLPSHLVGLCLSSQLLQDKSCHESWVGADWRNVYVRCMWDNRAFHKEVGAPIYIQWRENYQTSSLVEALTPYRAKIPKDVLQSFLTLIHCNRIGRCLEIILQELKKRPAELKYNHYPIYRDLLFFAYTTIPSKSLNVAAFEPEFRREFDRLFHENRKLIQPSDGPPSVASIFCKRYFHELSL